MCLIDPGAARRTTNSPSQVIPCAPGPDLAVSSLLDGLRSRHSFGCALVTRSGACDCTPNLRTSSRGFTYDLGQMLGEGWYGDEDGA